MKARKCVYREHQAKCFHMQTKPWFHLSMILSISNLAQVKDVTILMHSSRLYHSSMFSVSLCLFCTLQDMWCIRQLNDYFNPLHQ